MLLICQHLKGFLIGHLLLSSPLNSTYLHFLHSGWASRQGNMSFIIFSHITVCPPTQNTALNSAVIFSKQSELEHIKLLHLYPDKQRSGI